MPQIQNSKIPRDLLAGHNISSLEYETISHSVTIVPRLEYSENLIFDIIAILKTKRKEIKKSNTILISEFDENNKAHIDAVNQEKTILISLEILTSIKKLTDNVSDVQTIPHIFSSSIQLIRTLSAQLFRIVPECSKKLSELSIHLGSIVLDSAALTNAQFDFSQSNEESSILLDEVKLIVDSKISKQYSNVEFFRLCNT